MTNCTLCSLHEKAEQVLMAPVAPANPLFAVVGELPTIQGAKKGEPLSGPTFDMLWDELGDRGLDRSQAFMTNVIKCATTEEVKKSHANVCSTYLLSEIDWLAYETDCKAVLAVGSRAFQALGGKGGIMQAQGVPYEYMGIMIVPLANPRAAMRSPKALQEFRNGLDAFTEQVIGKQKITPTRTVLVNADH